MKGTSLRLLKLTIVDSTLQAMVPGGRAEIRQCCCNFLNGLNFFVQERNFLLMKLTLCNL